MKSICLNRELPAPEAGKTNWVHLAPIGEFPGVMISPDGEETRVVQVIDTAALALIVSNFEPRRLVDFEHRSDLPDGDTSAAAWILALDRRADGLWGEFDYSDLGASAVSNKRYRNISPTFDVEAVPGRDHTVRPVKLISAAFTNKPNLKALKPLFNQAAASSPQKGPQQMKELALALGLAEDADAAAILAGVQKMTADLAAAQAKIADLEKAGLEAEAETFVAENKARIKDPAAVKAQYVANKAATVAVFASLAEPQPVVHNRAAAQTPAAGAEPLSRAAQQQKLVAEIRNRDRCDHKRAFNTARAERPELFKEEPKKD